jgi:hypothetical protein
MPSRTPAREAYAPSRRCLSLASPRSTSGPQRVNARSNAWRFLITPLFSSDRHRTAPWGIALQYSLPIFFLATSPTAALPQSIQWSVVDTIGSIRDAVTPSVLSALASDGLRIFVAPLEGAESTMAVYEGTAAPLMLGREGDGPGEYRRIISLSLKANRLHVYSAGRETILDDSLRVIGSRRIPFASVMSAVALSDSSSVVQVLIRDRSTAGQVTSRMQLYRIGADSVMALGSPIAFPSNYIRTSGIVRVLGLAPSAETFWTSDKDQFLLQKWESSGRILRTLRLTTPPWFVSATGDPTTSYDFSKEPPPSGIIAIREDTQGRLWVASAVPRSSWSLGRWLLELAVPRSMIRLSSWLMLCPVGASLNNVFHSLFPALRVTTRCTEYRTAPSILSALFSFSSEHLNQQDLQR